MKNIIRHNKFLFAIFAFVLMAVACVSVTSQLNPTVDAANTSVNYSFATIAEAATQYLNHSYDSADDIGMLDEVESLSMSNAGGLLGYQDNEQIDNESVFTVSGPGAGNTVTYNYAALSRMKQDVIMNNGFFIWDIYTINSEKTSSFAGYAYYGRALSLLGFDDTAVVGSNDSSRLLIGIVIMTLYVLSTGLSSFFEMILAMLQLANPFRFFATSTALNGLIDGINVSETDAGTFRGDMMTALANVADFFANMYDALHSMSLYVILPLTFAIAIFIWLVVRKGTGFWSTFKGFFVKCAFVAVGVPFMLSCYTIALDFCEGFVANNVNATSVVASMFCDFEAWVTSSHLRLPYYYTSGYDVKYDVSSDSLDTNTITKTRRLCSAINSSSGAVGDVYNPALSNSPLNNFVQYDIQMLNKVDEGTLGSIKQFRQIINLLQKYMNGDKISAAAIESSYKSANLDSNDNYVAMMALSSHWTYFDSSKVTELKKDNAGVDVDVDTAEVWTINRWTDELWYSQDDSLDPTTAASNLWNNGGSIEAAPDGSKFVYKSTSVSGRGLSTMSMYNYLSTDFNTTDMTVYSALNTTNDQVKVSHYSVNLIGSGVMQLIYLLDGIALMGCFTVLGYGYGFALLISNFKAIFKMLPTVLSGMVGSMRGIASALILTAAMICEVLVTILLYSLATDLIRLVYTLVEAPLATLLSSSSESNIFKNLSELAIPLLGVISIITLVALTRSLLTWRHAIVQSTTDVCTSMINKFLQTNVASPDLSAGANTLGGKVLNAASIGAGLAMSSGALNNSETFQNIKDKANDAANGLKDKDKTVDEENPLGVKTGNGTGADENGKLADKSAEIDGVYSESSKMGEDGITDERGSNFDNTTEEYVKNNEGLFGESDVSTAAALGAGYVAASGRTSGTTSGTGDKTATKSSKPGRKLTSAEALGVHKDASSNLVDADNNSVIKNDDGSYSYAPSESQDGFVDVEGNAVTRQSDGTFTNSKGEKVDARDVVDADGNSIADNNAGSYDYYKGIEGAQDSDEMFAYEEADLADDGVRNHSADADTVLADHRQKHAVANGKGGGYNKGVNPRPKTTSEYADKYDESYTDADWADDGQLNESVKSGGKNAEGKFVAPSSEGSMSDAYNQNYSEDYAAEDYADDGQYNGSVDATQTEDYQTYLADDYADDGQYNGSVGEFSGTKFTASSTQPSEAYKQNHSQEYADADVTDDGKYNGSVASVKQKGVINVRPGSGPSDAYKKNYSEEYANADFVDDGQYNGSVDVTGTNGKGQFVSTGAQATDGYKEQFTQEYADADLADNGVYDASVESVAHGGKRTVAPNARPSQKYQKNYSSEYAKADFVDDGQYNGSVQVTGTNAQGQFTTTSEYIDDGNGAQNSGSQGGTVHQRFHVSASDANSQMSTEYKNMYTDEYIQADLADDGIHNESVQSTATASGKKTAAPAHRSDAYRSNYSAAYTDADFKDDGKYNGSVATGGRNTAGQFTTTSEYINEGGNTSQASTSAGGNVHTRFHTTPGQTNTQATPEYRNMHTDEYIQADYADNGKYDSSVQSVMTSSGRRTIATPNRPSETYKQNYSAAYADADFKDDGKYNGSVASGGQNSYGQFTTTTEHINEGGNTSQASTSAGGNVHTRFHTTSGGGSSPNAAYNAIYTDEYAEVDYADDGKYNGSVQGTISSKGVTAKPNAGPSNTYKQNYSAAYASADYADDGKYNGSVTSGGQNSRGQFTTTTEYINEGGNTPNPAPTGTNVHQRFHVNNSGGGASGNGMNYHTEDIYVDNVQTNPGVNGGAFTSGRTNYKTSTPSGGGGNISGSTYEVNEHHIFDNPSNNPGNNRNVLNRTVNHTSSGGGTSGSTYEVNEHITERTPSNNRGGAFNDRTTTTHSTTNNYSRPSSTGGRGSSRPSRPSNSSKPAASGRNSSGVQNDSISRAINTPGSRPFGPTNGNRN